MGDNDSYEGKATEVAGKVTGDDCGWDIGEAQQVDGDVGEFVLDVVGSR